MTRQLLTDDPAHSAIPQLQNLSGNTAVDKTLSSPNSQGRLEKPYLGKRRPRRWQIAATLFSSSLASRAVTCREKRREGES